MDLNFSSIVQDEYLDDMAELLAAYTTGFGAVNRERLPPPGYESFVCVDVLGPEFVWMNDAFPKDKFTWYFWFESIFLVPEDMATFLSLKWSRC